MLYLSLRCSGMARVNKRSGSSTCHHHPYVSFTSGMSYRLPAVILQPQSVTAIWPVFIFHTAEGRRQSWPDWVERYLELGTHYPRSRTVFTGREHSPWTRVSKFTPVFTGRVGHQSIAGDQHGLWTWVSFFDTGVILDTRVQGRGHDQWPRPVNTARGHG